MSSSFSSSSNVSSSLSRIACTTGRQYSLPIRGAQTELVGQAGTAPGRLGRPAGWLATQPDLNDPRSGAKHNVPRPIKIENKIYLCWRKERKVGRETHLYWRQWREGGHSPEHWSPVLLTTTSTADIGWQCWCGVGCGAETRL